MEGQEIGCNLATLRCNDDCPGQGHAPDRPNGRNGWERVTQLGPLHWGAYVRHIFATNERNGAQVLFCHSWGRDGKPIQGWGNKWYAGNTLWALGQSLGTSNVTRAGCHWPWRLLQRLPLQRFEGLNQPLAPACGTSASDLFHIVTEFNHDIQCRIAKTMPSSWSEPMPWCDALQIKRPEMIQMQYLQ